MEKLHILKITDRNDHLSDDMYYTPNFLRERVLTDFYDMWDDTGITKEEIIGSDEKLFDFMDKSGYDIEIVCTVTKDEFN